MNEQWCGWRREYDEPRTGFSAGNEIYFSWRMEDVGGIEVSIL